MSVGERKALLVKIALAIVLAFALAAGLWIMLHSVSHKGPAEMLLHKSPAPEDHEMSRPYEGKVPMDAGTEKPEDVTGTQGVANGTKGPTR